MTLGQNKEAIFQFRPFISSMPNFITTRDLLLNRYVEGGVCLTRPGVNPNERHVAVGTDNESGPQALLMIDTHTMRDSMEGEIVVSRASLEKGVQCLQWLGPDRLVVSAGKKEGPSNLRVYGIDVDGTCQLELRDESFTTNDTVREIAANQLQTNVVAYGGYEPAISIRDFNTDSGLIKVLPTEGDVSSVRWSPFLGGGLVSCTTVEGQLRIYDVGESKSDPAWLYQTDIQAHKNLYSHCQISEYQILLGYEDNYMEAIDIRKNQKGLGNFMTGAYDPYCYMVGDLHYRENSGMLLVTGMADFTVYKHYRSGPDKNIAKLWCHTSSSANRNSNDSSAVRHGVFLNDTWVVSTQESLLSLHKLD